MKIGFDVENNVIVVRGKPDIKKIECFLPAAVSFNLEKIDKETYLVRGKNSPNRYNPNIQFYTV